MFKSTRFLLTIVMSSLSREEDLCSASHKQQSSSLSSLSSRSSSRTVVFPLCDSVLFLLSILLSKAEPHMVPWWEAKIHGSWRACVCERRVIFWLKEAVWTHCSLDTVHSTPLCLRSLAVWVIEDWCPDVNDLSRTLSSVHKTCLCVLDPVAHSSSLQSLCNLKKSYPYVSHFICLCVCLCICIPASFPPD